VYRDVEYRPWKGQRYPERVEIEHSVASEARILRVKRPRTFLVGSPMTIAGKVQVAGNTPMPSQAPAGPGYGWDLTVKIRWSNGQERSLPTRFTDQLQPGGSVSFGPLHPKVEVSGVFSIVLRHPSSLVLKSPDGKSESGTYGTEDHLLCEEVAVDMGSLYKKWSFWATLVAVGVSVTSFGFLVLRPLLGIP